MIGPEVPLSSDHYGHIDVNSCIRLARAMEKHHLAWMEDMVPWQLGELMKQIKDATDIPILTGEDIFLKEDFAKLVEMGAVDMIHPDLASAGGILETKKIGDHAMEHGVAMAMHFAGSPVSFMANLHCASATENFVALEHHSVDVPWWEDLVTGPDEADQPARLRHAARPARARDRAGGGGREGAPQARHAVLRADDGVGQRALLGPPLELTMIRRLFLLSAVIGGVGGPAAAPAVAQSVQLSVDASRSGAKIDRNIFGQFAEHLGHGVYEGVWVGPESKIPNTRGIRNDVVTALKALRVPNVRWPGGCFADEYHWRKGIGPRRDVTLNPNWGGVTEPNTFGTHEFMDFLAQIGAEAYVSVNVGSGTPQEAAEWLEYLTTAQPTALGEGAGRQRP